MILTDIRFTIPRDQVLLRLKYNIQKSEIPERVDTMISQMIDEGTVLAEPQAVVKEYGVALCTENEVRFHECDYVVRGSSIAKHLTGCFQVSFFACTIGKAYHTVLTQMLGEKEIAQATILDAVCSEAVEAVADSVNAIITANAQRVKAETLMRYSPGYGDWPLQDQKQLLLLLDASSIGITVTDSCMMSPEKSVTAVVGWKKR